MCFCGNVITLEKKNDRMKVTFRIKSVKRFLPAPYSKTKQNEIELVVLGSRIEETAFARTCITRLAACDILNASTSPAKAQGQLLLSPPGSTLTFLVDSSFVNVRALLYFLPVGPASEPGIGQREIFSSPTCLIMPSSNYVARVKGFKHSLGASLQIQSLNFV